MGRSYAGILGIISFGTVITRALLDGGNVESALGAACGAMFGFAAIGFLVGQMAERLVVEAIRNRFADQWSTTAGTVAAEARVPAETASDAAA